MDLAVLVLCVQGAADVAHASLHLAQGALLYVPLLHWQLFGVGVGEGWSARRTDSEEVVRLLRTGDDLFDFNGTHTLTLAPPFDDAHWMQLPDTPRGVVSELLYSVRSAWAAIAIAPQPVLLGGVAVHALQRRQDVAQTLRMLHRLLMLTSCGWR